MPAQSFFRKWYEQQDSLTQDRVKVLIQDGQLDLVGGGWVSNDEAICHYSDIIDQLTLGHRCDLLACLSVLQCMLLQLQNG